MTSETLRAISPACPGKRAGPLAAAALLALAPPAAADSGLPFATLVAVCASCHGHDGRQSIVSGWGRIAGQNEAYLAYALALYRAGGRRGQNAGLMQPYAAVLDDREIERLAAHYSRLR
jgi:cytochrome c553